MFVKVVQKQKSGPEDFLGEDLFLFLQVLTRPTWLYRWPGVFASEGAEIVSIYVHCGERIDGDRHSQVRWRFVRGQ